MENKENKEESLKALVREKYSEIALQSKEQNMSSCCGSGSCSTDVYSIMAEDYTSLNGYTEKADLGLGCGLPTEFARIKQGQTVLDLGSGAGNDCFVARAEVGEEGKVIGVDFTPAMVELAKKNAKELGYTNVEFHLGDIEHLPLPASSVDVVVSNCVLNLVPNKKKVFEEMYKVIKPGGHFSVSDIVLVGELPESVKGIAEMYAGCVSGAIQKEEYLGLATQAGFGNLRILKEKKIQIPRDILANYLNEEELAKVDSQELGIYSIHLFGKKAKECCSGDCC